MIPPSVRQSAQLLHRPVASTSSHIFKTTGSTLRHSSSTSGLPAFAPLGRTSADTLIPYGNPDQASSAYLPSLTGAVADPASLTTPLDLNAAQRLALERIIRVDQAGEVGANYIYKGQLAVLSRGKDAGVLDLVQVSPYYLPYLPCASY
jgi:ubiquinone biosynthesis monooxygenase Coq7